MNTGYVQTNPLDTIEVDPATGEQATVIIVPIGGNPLYGGVPNCIKFSRGGLAIGSRGPKSGIYWRPVALSAAIQWVKVITAIPDGAGSTGALLKELLVWASCKISPTESWTARDGQCDALARHSRGSNRFVIQLCNPDVHVHYFTGDLPGRLRIPGFPNRLAFRGGEIYLGTEHNASAMAEVERVTFLQAVVWATSLRNLVAGDGRIEFALLQWAAQRLEGHGGGLEQACAA